MAFKSTGRRCNLCNNIVDCSVESFVEHGETFHPNYFFNYNIGEQIKQGKTPLFIEKKYYCPLDEHWYGSRIYLARTIKKHGLTNEQYYCQYGQEYMPEEWATNNFDEKYGNSSSIPPCLECNKPTKFTEGKWHYPRFCGFSCSTTWHAKNTDRVAQAEQTKKERNLIDPTHGLRPSQKEYWIQKGFDETQAKIKVSERQKKMCSMEYAIEKHGEERGIEIYNDGLVRRKEAIAKSDMFKGHSNVSVQLFEKLQKNFPEKLLYGSDETSVYAGSAKKYVWVDCLYKEKKKIIEFYGLYWHASPKKYQATDVIFKSNNITAADIWAKDAVRENILKKSGFDLLVIWEDDYTNNPEWVMQKCISFLQDRC